MSNRKKRYSHNVAQFKKLISIVASLGKNYVPERETLEQSNLEIILSDAELSLKELFEDSGKLEDAALAREIGFEELQQIAVRLSQTIGQISPSLKDDKTAISLIEKLAGDSHSLMSEAYSLKDENHSKSAFVFSQLSYETQLVFFERLIRILASRADYQPEEYDLSINTLHARLTDLRKKNVSALNAATALSNSRMIADEVFCDPESGLNSIAEMVKESISRTFGKNSFEYSQIKNLNFSSFESVSM